MQTPVFVVMEQAEKKITIPIDKLFIVWYKQLHTNKRRGVYNGNGI